MNTMRIVLDPESQGLGFDLDGPNDPKLIHLANTELVVSGLKDGMASGSPSIMFGFKLPDGKIVIAETSWKLFAAAYAAFAGKFGLEVPEGMRADLAGIELEHEEPVTGQRVHLNIVGDDQPQWFECEICGKRIEQPPGKEGTTKIRQWVHRHYREHHPEWPPPDAP